MRTFIIAYDLAKPHLNQVYLANAIMSLGDSWARPLQTLWYVRSEASSGDIEARLSRLLDDDDGLVIQEARGEVALSNTGVRWFRQRRNAGIDNDANVVRFPAPVTTITLTPEQPAEELRAAG